MPHDDILNMFRRVLSGTKYGLKQTRGKFGLGAKMQVVVRVVDYVFGSHKFA
uniref:Type II DNA topoisomerase VI subunit B n=1 Tax=Solanum tuberosum TaxID=4113 RepID=M1BNC2_SOLTU